MVKDDRRPPAAPPVNYNPRGFWADYFDLTKIKGAPPVRHTDWLWILLLGAAIFVAMLAVYGAFKPL